jgi:N-acetylneuraminate synthase/N,N'-diacetyllegionaminate synthase
MAPANIELFGKTIGVGRSPFVIAEIGVNHNGDVDLACRMIAEAARQGADCVKFQTFRAETLATKAAPKAAYQMAITEKTESQFEMLKNLELSPEAHMRIIRECQAQSIGFMSTPYSIEDVDFLDKLDVAAYKIASGQIAEPSFIEHVASKKKPVILSTGMADLAEVETAVKTVSSTGNRQLVLLQCTTEYPSDYRDANLRAMLAMADTFSVLVGYSDHTTNPAAAIAAAALGAVVIEKHFTLDKTMPGPDHAASAEPAELGTLIRMVRQAYECLGSPWKQPSEVELRNRVTMRRSVVTRSPIAAGETVTREMLTLKRPGTGLAPSWVEKLIGQRAAHDIRPETLLTLGDISWSKDVQG